MQTSDWMNPREAAGPLKSSSASVRIWWTQTLRWPRAVAAEKQRGRLQFRIGFSIQLKMSVLGSSLTGVSITTLSLKLPMKAMIVIFCMSLSILLNCIMNRSSSVKLSRGLRSFSNCRRTLTSFSVGWKRIRHSTKSTGRVRKSNLNDDQIKKDRDEYCKKIYLSGTNVWALKTHSNENNFDGVFNMFLWHFVWWWRRYVKIIKLKSTFKSADCWSLKHFWPFKKLKNLIKSF